MCYDTYIMKTIKVIVSLPMDKKIACIKFLRWLLMDTSTGYVPGLKVTKDMVEEIFRDSVDEKIALFTTETKWPLSEVIREVKEENSYYDCSFPPSLKFSVEQFIESISLDQFEELIT